MNLSPFHESRGLLMFSPLATISALMHLPSNLDRSTYATPRPPSRAFSGGTSTTRKLPSIRAKRESDQDRFVTGTACAASPAARHMNDNIFMAAPIISKAAPLRISVDA